MDESLSIGSRIGVVLLVSAVLLLVSEQVLQPGEELRFCLSHMADKHFQNPFVRQDAPFKISVFDVHSSTFSRPPPHSFSSRGHQHICVATLPGILKRL
jgi:hypothetical protein